MDRTTTIMKDMWKSRTFYSVFLEWSDMNFGSQGAQRTWRVTSSIGFNEPWKGRAGQGM